MVCVSKGPVTPERKTKNMSRYKSTDDISVVLLDNKGFTITSQECESIKEAKERARYYISDSYERNAETTHEVLGTEKAEVRVNGECLWDVFRAACFKS